MALLLGGVALGLLLVDEELGQPDVVGRVKEDAAGRLPVPPGAAGLLVVALEVLGHIVVDDEPDVGLVDAHAEGVGGHHHLHPVEQKILLVLAAAGGVHLAVVGRGLDAQPPQHGTRLLHLADGAAIDDAGRVPLVEQEVHQGAGLFAFAQPPGLQLQIGAVEARRQPERLLQAQLGLDVPADPRGGGGRKGRDHRPGGQLVDERADLQIAGAEVVPPLADAVRLVHRHHADRLRLGEAQEALGHQPLRGHIDDLVPAVPGAAQHQGLLAGGQAAVQVGRGHSRRHQRPHLVLHQADEGADHQRHPRQQQSRHLIAHRLARPGGHDRQHVPARQGRVHDLGLPRPEAVVPEHLFQNVLLAFHPAASSLSCCRQYTTFLAWGPVLPGRWIFAARHGIINADSACLLQTAGQAQLPCKLMQPLRPGHARRLLWRRSLYGTKTHHLCRAVL